MATLKDRLDRMKAEAEGIHETIPEITDIWYEFTDIPINELVAVAEEYDRKPTYDDISGRLRVQLPHRNGITCFCYSIPVTLKEIVNAGII